MATLTIRPNEAGSYQEWSLFGGTTHYGSTSDQSTSTGVYINDTTSLETEGLASVSGYSGTINSVTAKMQAQAYNGSGDEEAVLLWYMRGESSESSAFALTSSWQNFSDQRTTSPFSSSAWTWDELESLEIGSRANVVGSSEAVQVAEFWVEIDYTPALLKEVSDTGSGTDSLEVLHTVSDSGALSSEKARVYKMTVPEPESNEETLGAATRMVELIRVGNINLKSDYPGKQIVRLRDMSAFYEGRPVKNLADLYEYVRGKRLSGVNVDIWDQISGAYLGAYNTDQNGTLVLPTDRNFAEVLQWKLAGGGYSDCFNGERAAGTPGLFFYFHCNEGSGVTIKSFPGVSGQMADWDGNWYEKAFFKRPALKTSASSQLSLVGLDPQGHRGFQFLWYCNDASADSTIWSYAQGSGVGATPGFRLKLTSGFLEAYVGAALATGTTEIESGKWYLIQINTKVIPTGYNMESSKVLYTMQNDTYIGQALEATASQSNITASGFLFGVVLDGNENDGFDEIRHLNRNLDTSEIAHYAAFLKTGRRSSKSDGELGTLGW